jgi:hypothetical protein
MPKILINEKDRTSPGAPGGYANFSVLLAGFEAPATGDMGAKREKLRDSNGVYEFSSAEAFKETIGLVAPEAEIDIDNDVLKVYHYGNQMAYELLNMGYSIIYKVVNKNNLDVLGETSFWDDFKDKSSYDFRFITHGLLESSSFASEEEKTEYEDSVARLRDVEEAVAELRRIDTEVDKEMPPEEGESADKQAERSGKKQEAYAAIAENFAGFDTEYGKTNNHFTTFQVAWEKLIGTATKQGELYTRAAAIEALLGGRITTALINKANTCIANLAQYTASGAMDVNGDATNDMYMKEIPGRGDCVALIEADEKLYVSATGTQSNPELKIIDAINEMTGINASNGKFCAMTVPSVVYTMKPDGAFADNKKFPGAFHYLACFMNSLQLGFAEWYAAAGYTRGVASYLVDHTSVKLGEIAINALEPRNIDDPQSDYPKFACNVIANFRGSYYLWGNRTAHPLGKKGNLENGDLIASSFLNIRQLCCTIKKQLYVACRSFTFDPNSDVLWVNFCNAIRPTLEAMKADQGIRDFKISKQYTDKKATLKAKIRIIPIEAVEDFDLEVSLEDSFGETAAVVSE